MIRGQAGKNLTSGTRSGGFRAGQRLLHLIGVGRVGEGRLNVHDAGAHEFLDFYVEMKMRAVVLDAGETLGFDNLNQGNAA